mmetsp:Transcript_10440/g.45352  ORF Transcript_10440/g.45352 Transcript_10440/m.45352 type:complete len:451 (-) Transcript_10440:1769-3121(-)
MACLWTRGAMGLGGCPRFAAALACSWWSITSADLSASRSKVGLTGRMSWTTLEMRARHPSSLRSSVLRSVSLSPMPENPPKLFCRKPPLPRLFCRSLFSFDKMSFTCIFLPTISTIGGMLGIDGASLNILHHSVHSGARKHSSMTRMAQPSLRLCARKIAVATSADHSFLWCSVCGNLAPASMYTCVAAPAHVTAWPIAFARERFAMTDNTRVSGSSCRSRAVSTLFRTSRGTLSTIVVPLSSSDEQVIVPPTDWTMLLVMARPKPVPPYSRVEETEAWPKGMNMSLSLSRAMPMPLSQTSNATTTLGACGARKSFSITCLSAPWFVPSSFCSWCWSRASPIVHDLPRPTPLAMSSWLVREMRRATGSSSGRTVTRRRTSPPSRVNLMLLLMTLMSAWRSRNLSPLTLRPSSSGATSRTSSTWFLFAWWPTMSTSSLTISLMSNDSITSS